MSFIVLAGLPGLPNPLVDGKSYVLFGQVRPLYRKITFCQ